MKAKISLYLAYGSNIFGEIPRKMCQYPEFSFYERCIKEMKINAIYIQHYCDITEH